MDTPGPLRKARPGLFQCDRAGPPDTPLTDEQLMGQFNRGTILSTAIHEAYGHYVQFLWVPQGAEQGTQTFGAVVQCEGWAHYCEQMMLDEVTASLARGHWTIGCQDDSPGATAGCATTRCPVCRGHPDAHRADDVR